jgi:hypothetical protein
MADEPSRPEACQVVDPALLADISPAYAVRTAGSNAWCEGILPKPIGVPPLKILSVKAGPRTSYLLEPNRPAKLSWCDGAPARLRLTALGKPRYVLDVTAAGSFVWRTDIARASNQKDWSSLSALASRTMTVQQENRDVAIPVSIDGVADRYYFLVGGNARLQDALVVSAVDPTDRRSPTATVTSRGNLSEIAVSFQGIPYGIYRVSFSEPASAAGRTTPAVYILHGDCGAAP